MDWESVTIMDQRVRFIAECLKGYFPCISSYAMIFGEEYYVITQERDG